MWSLFRSRDITGSNRFKISPKAFTLHWRHMDGVFRTTLLLCLLLPLPKTSRRLCFSLGTILSNPPPDEDKDCWSRGSYSQLDPSVDHHQGCSGKCQKPTDSLFSSLLLHCFIFAAVCSCVVAPVRDVFCCSSVCLRFSAALFSFWILMTETGSLDTGSWELVSLRFFVFFVVGFFFLPLFFFVLLRKQRLRVFVWLFIQRRFYRLFVFCLAFLCILSGTEWPRGCFAPRL